MNMLRLAARPAAAVAVLLGAVACGSGGSPAAAKAPAPATLVREVRTAVQHASSVHVSGSITQAGKQLGLDLSLTRAGGLSGRLSASGAGFFVLSTHGSTYIKVTGAFLRYAHLSTTACTLMCGKYLKLTSSQAQGMTGSLSMATLLGGTAKTSPHVRNVGTATVNGQRAWVLRGSDGTTAYVAAQGNHYLLRLVPPGGKGRLDFTQWNAVKIPAPPPPGQVVDLSQLHG
jgi:hypothetical protein